MDECQLSTPHGTLGTFDCLSVGEMIATKLSTPHGTLGTKRD